LPAAARSASKPGAGVEDPGAVAPSRLSGSRRRWALAYDLATHRLDLRIDPLPRCTGEQEAVVLTADGSSPWSGVPASPEKGPLLPGTDGGTHLHRGVLSAQPEGPDGLLVLGGDNRSRETRSCLTYPIS